MLAGFRLVLNRPGIAALAKGREVKGVTRERAEDAAEAARSIAPVRTGAFRSSIGVEDTDDGARVIATDPGAIYIELGTSDTPAHASLRRGAESAGLELRAR
jgi:hypothetical protein